MPPAGNGRGPFAIPILSVLGYDGGVVCLGEVVGFERRCAAGGDGGKVRGSGRYFS